MNSADIIVIAAVAALVLLAVGSVQRNKKRGKRGCGCQCPGCGGVCGKSASAKKDT